MPILKVCGLTRVCDLRLALRLGADYVGVIVDIPRSPRSLPVHVAALLLRGAAGRGVAVTERADVGALRGLAEALRPAALQLHASPPAEVVHSLAEALPDVELWPVLSLPADREEAVVALPGLLALAAEYAAAGARRCLLDTRVAGRSGGTGVTADWALAAEVVRGCPVPVILAGGLGPANLAAALAATSAAGGDVSSGVERAPGIKAPALLAALFANRP
jgi:phosphoribosylanthranilate isomerase